MIFIFNYQSLKKMEGDLYLPLQNGEGGSLPGGTLPGEGGGGGLFSVGYKQAESITVCYKQSVSITVCYRQSVL